MKKGQTWSNIAQLEDDFPQQINNFEMTKGKFK